jgi:hypothetical protein
MVVAEFTSTENPTFSTESVDSDHPGSTIRKAVGRGHLTIGQPLDEQ